MEEKTAKFDEFIDYGRRMTSVSLSVDDYLFVKQKGLMFSQLLHDKIREEMAIDSGTIIDNVREMNEKIKTLADRFQQAISFMDKKGIGDEFIGGLK